MWVKRSSEHLKIERQLRFSNVAFTVPILTIPIAHNVDNEKPTCKNVKFIWNWISSLSYGGGDEGGKNSGRDERNFSRAKREKKCERQMETELNTFLVPLMDDYKLERKFA